MSKPASIREVTLMPGDFYWGSDNCRIITILGSCVAICVWHREMRTGGMCHYLLPERVGERDGELDGKYGNEAVALILNSVKRFNTREENYQVKIFGGSEMFAELRGKFNMDIGGKNARTAVDLMKKHGFNIYAKQLGGRKSRKIFFDLWSGDVWIKKF